MFRHGITPRSASHAPTLTDITAYLRTQLPHEPGPAHLAAGGETAQRAFAAMQTMQKIDIAAIEAAVAGR